MWTEYLRARKAFWNLARLVVLVGLAAVNSAIASGIKPACSKMSATVSVEIVDMMKIKDKIGS